LKKIFLLLAFWIFFLNIADAVNASYSQNQELPSATATFKNTVHSSTNSCDFGECADVCHSNSCHAGICQAISKMDSLTFHIADQLEIDFYTHNYQTPFLGLDKKPPKIS